MNLVNFGSKLKRIRENKKISVADLSIKTNISESMLRYYERGEKNPSLANVIDIAKTLDISIIDLTGEELKRDEKLNYINFIMKKHGIEAGFYNVDKLSDDEVMRLEEDVITFLQFIQEKYKLNER